MKKLLNPHIISYIAVILIVVIIIKYFYHQENYYGWPLQPSMYENVPKKYRPVEYINMQEYEKNTENFGNPQPVSKTKAQVDINRIIFDYPSIYEDPYKYPNVMLPDTVIGCSGRNTPCMGGSQASIVNTIPPVNISNQNIAPINLTVRGFDEGIQQLGTIQKVFGNDNEIFPLFGKRRYRNDNQWEYYVKFGKYGVILPVFAKRPFEQLFTNDEVRIEGQKDKYRVIIYDENIPQYLPYS